MSGALILVADDDEDIRSLVTLRLERAGYDVVTASDGETALDLAIVHHPDLAVLDVMMPKLTGLEVTRRLRAHDDTKTIGVVLLTARVQDDDLAAGDEAGADAYVRKPFSAHELSARVDAILAAQGADR